MLSPWAGAAADRFDRRRLLMVSEIVAAVLSAVLAVLAFAGVANEWVVIGFTLGLGIASAFAAPAQAALVAGLVAQRDLPTAVALNSMTFNLARAVGPALAALAVVTVGIPAAFAINSATYLAIVVALLVVSPRPQERRPRPSCAKASGSCARIGASSRYLLVVGAVGYASDPINTLAPAFAEAYGRNDTFAGFIVGVFGLGAVTAALVDRRPCRRVGARGWR